MVSVSEKKYECNAKLLRYDCEVKSPNPSDCSKDGVPCIYFNDRPFPKKQERYMKQKRECSRCGECCRYIAIEKTWLHRDTLDWMMAIGLKEDQGFFLIPYQCAKLIEPPTSKDKHSCAIHNTKPRICKMFHGQKRSAGQRYWVPPGCTMKEHP
jgi:hypothetical protein